MDCKQTKTETTTTEAFPKGNDTFTLVRIESVWSHRPDQVDRLWEARADDGTNARLGYGRGHEVTDKDRASIARAWKKHQADQTIQPAANAAAVDFGRDFDPRVEHRSFCAVDFDTVQVGDLVWVYSYQVWRRGVVESIGRTNLKVAVTVASTRTFSRQSVKAGEVFWDILNKR